MTFQFEPTDTPTAWVEWDNGVLNGDSNSVKQIHSALTRSPETVTLPPVGPTISFSLDNPAAVLIFLINVLGYGTATGDVPEIDNEVPEGAIA